MEIVRERERERERERDRLFFPVFVMTYECLLMIASGFGRGR